PTVYHVSSQARRTRGRRNLPDRGVYAGTEVRDRRDERYPAGRAVARRVRREHLADDARRGSQAAPERHRGRRQAPQAPPGPAEAVGDPGRAEQPHPPPQAQAPPADPPTRVGWDGPSAHGII